jgi:predicted transcriptional regulator
MDIQILQDIGLTNIQALAYKALVDGGPQSAPTVAAAIGESRTNSYKVLDKLVELSLAVKEPFGGKFHYSATSPAALEQLVRQQAETIHQKERRLNSELPHLLDYYFAHSERPSIRYFEGKDGIVSIYKDQIATGQPLCYIHTSAAMPFVGFQDLHQLRNTFPRLGIPRRTLSTDNGPGIPLPPEEQYPIAKSDEAMLLERTWIQPEDYSAPVEWSVYGDKLSVISYGEEAMGMIIESAPIAQAFQQLFNMLEEGMRRRPGYHLLPLRTTYTAFPESIKRQQ